MIHIRKKKVEFKYLFSPSLTGKRSPKEVSHGLRISNVHILTKSYRLEKEVKKKKKKNQLHHQKAIYTKLHGLKKKKKLYLVCVLIHD